MKESLRFAVITKSDVNKRKQLVGKMVQWAGYTTSVGMGKLRRMGDTSHCYCHAGTIADFFFKVEKNLDFYLMQNLIHVK